MGKIFLAFSGIKIEQEEKRFQIDDCFECWNLKKMGFIEFVNEIRSVIPPINRNITDRNYLNSYLGKVDMPSIYERCSWGLLLPHNEERDHCYEEQIELIINLFSDEFLYPIFVAHDMGLVDKINKLPQFWHDPEHTQNKSEIFKSSSFVTFYKELLPMTSVLAGNTMDIDRWSLEQTQISMACFLFNDLKRYFTKNPYVYHREYMDICVIAETLLTFEYDPWSNRKKPEKWKAKNVGSRAALLIGSKFTDCASLFKQVHDERNAFAHGKTYKQIKRYSMEKVYSDKTIAYNKKHFELTDKAQNYLRHLLVAYIFLYLIKKKDSYFTKRANLKIIDEATGNLFLCRGNGSKPKRRLPNKYLRQKIKQYCVKILNLMP